MLIADVHGRNSSDRAPASVPPGGVAGSFCVMFVNRHLAGGEPNVCKCVAGPRFAGIGLL